MYNDEEKENDFDENQNYESSTGNKFLDFYYANKKLVIILGVLILVLLILLGISSCGRKSNNVEDEIAIVISKENVNVTIDNTVQLASSVKNVPNAQVVWTTDDASIATINNQGLVTGIKYGTTTVSATYTHTDSKIYKASCIVVVAKGDPNLTITEASFPDGTILLSAGNTFKVPLLITPSNGFIKVIKYTSSDQNTAIISEDGTITAIKSGKVVIKLNVNNGEFIDNMDVIVTNDNVPSQVVVFPSSLNFKESLIKISTNNPINLEYDYLPVEANISNLIWESSDNNIVTVSKNGQVIGVNQGIATITVKTLNGLSSSIIVNVETAVVEVENIEIVSGTNQTITKGDTHTIVANVLPSNASNKGVTYSSSNTSIATVDAFGNVRAVGVGSCTITVTTNDQGKKATININVVSSSGTSGGGSTTTVGKVYISSDKNAVETTAAAAIANPVSAPVKVTVTYSSNVTNVKYCLYKLGDEACTPDISIKNKGTFTISDSGTTVIRHIIYNGSNSSGPKERFVEISGSTTPIDPETPTDPSTPPSVDLSQKFSISISHEPFSPIWAQQKIRVSVNYSGGKNTDSYFYICSGDNDDGKEKYCDVDTTTTKTVDLDYHFPIGESYWLDKWVSYRFDSPLETEIVGWCNMEFSVVAANKDGSKSQVKNYFVECN